MENTTNPGSDGDGIDDVLLESLFYNEILAMGETEDPMSERALLTDFGVPEAQLTPVHQTMTVSAQGASATAPIGQPIAVQQPPPTQQQMHHVSKCVAQQQPAPRPNQNLAVHPQPHHQPISQQLNHQVSPRPSVHLPSVSATHHVASRTTHPTAQSQAASGNASAPTSTYHEVDERKKKEQMISQFTMLANRLGISVPPEILDKVTSGAPVSPTVLVTDTKQEAEQTCAVAEAAISSVQEAQALKKHQLPPPIYSKRRRKPRLEDCKQRLEALKAEKALLERHLDRVQNRSKDFDYQRKQSEKEMKKLMGVGASKDNLEPLLERFRDMYADYGRHRHQELVFHLQQLERLAAPTNFTKMGLWTLGQKSELFYTDLKRNPIAGILRDALEITPAQGRKILSSRQRMHDLQQDLQETLQKLRKLQQLCEKKQAIFKDRMHKCEQILTPAQVVKLLVWVDENSGLLDTVCPGWGSERIHGNKQSGIAATSEAPSKAIRAIIQQRDGESKSSGSS